MSVEISPRHGDSDRKAEPMPGFRARRPSCLSEIERIRSKLGKLYTDKEDPVALDPFRKVEYVPKRRLRMLHEAFKEGI